MKVTLIPVARPTFDLETATHRTAAARRALGGVADVGGPGTPITDLADLDEALELVGDAERVVLLCATFTDGGFARRVAERVDAGLVLWGLPEERTGERLRLNSLCGINLAAYVLSDLDRPYGWVYADPEHPDITRRLADALDGPPTVPEVAAPPVDPEDREAAAAIADRLAGTRIGQIGDPPDGFDPCRAEPEDLTALGGAVLDRVELEAMFSRAGDAEPARVATLHREVSERLEGVASLDAEAVTASLRLHLALGDLGVERGWSAVATRCWPECFTEAGGAACTAQALCGDAGMPGMCEADVMGAITAVAVGAATGEAVQVVDLVDVDPADGTLAVWHCGNAPLAMAGDPPTATVHPNRGLPLLNQFRLRPGRVTLARFGRMRGGLRMAVGSGEILDRARPYAGTSAVIRPDRPVTELLATVMGRGLDHHIAVSHRDAAGVMVALAEQLGLEVVPL